MKFYVMSDRMFADGGRRWVVSRQEAHCFEEDLEAAKHHANTFRDPAAQRELRITHDFRDTPGHRDARAVGFCEE